MFDRNVINVQRHELITTETNWTADQAVGIFYNVLDGSPGGKWRMIFNINGNLSAGAASISINVVGVTFSSVAEQAITAFEAGATRAISRNATDAGASTMFAFVHTGSGTQWGFYGDVELESKPDFLE